MVNAPGFQVSKFNTLFPYYILLNKELVIESCGKGIQTAKSGITGMKFTDHFSVNNPAATTTDYNSLHQLISYSVTLTLRDASPVFLLGQFSYHPETDCLLFTGSRTNGSVPASLYNLDKLWKMSNGNEAFVDRMNRLFIEQIPVSLEQMNTALREKEAEVIRIIAHRLRPSIDIMNITSLKNDIRQVEQLATENKLSETLTNLICNINMVLAEVIASLSKTL